MKSRDLRHLCLPAGAAEANLAMVNYVSDRSVALVLDSGSRGFFIGSGTCVRLQDELLVATAAHNLDDLSVDASIRLLPRGIRGHPGLAFSARSRRRTSPTDPDVAWIELRGDDLTNTGLRFLDLEALEPSQPQAELSGVFVQGFPAAEVLVHSAPDIDPFSLGLLTTRLPSTTPEIVVEYPPQSPDDVGLELVPPNGVSGGGIWRFPRFEDSTVWSTERARLIGVTRSWSEQTGRLVAEPIQHWLALVASDFPELAPAIALNLGGDS